MASVKYKRKKIGVEYPCSDGRPMTETDRHRKNMIAIIDTLALFFEHEPLFYVSGNMFVYYVQGDRNKHLSPDVFVVWGVAKGDRDYYLAWEEGKMPDLVIELTSRSTRDEDLIDKFQLYQDTLKIPEYFLFDPRDEYLKPRLQGYRLHEGKYAPIKRIRGRLPSKVLGLHLENDDWELRLYNPATKQQLLTPYETMVQAQLARDQEAAARQLEAAARQQEAAARQVEAAARERAEAEVARLQRELDALRRQFPGQSE